METTESKSKQSGGGARKQVRKEIKEFEQRVKSLKERGFQLLAPAPVTEISTASASSESRLGSGDMIGGSAIQQTFSLFDERQSNPILVNDVGTKGLGYIPWGPGNKLPNLIYNLVASLPYTAAAIKYIVDLTVGLGPSLAYRTVRYANGKVIEELIPYENAGYYILNRMRELREKRGEDQNESTGSSSGKTITWGKAIGEEPEDEPEPGTLEFELKQPKSLSSLNFSYSFIVVSHAT